MKISIINIHFSILTLIILAISCKEKQVKQNKIIKNQALNKQVKKNKLENDYTYQGLSEEIFRQVLIDHNRINNIWTKLNRIEPNNIGKINREISELPNIKTKYKISHELIRTEALLKSFLLDKATGISTNREDLVKLANSDWVKYYNKAELLITDIKKAFLLNQNKFSTHNEKETVFTNSELELAIKSYNYLFTELNFIKRNPAFIKYGFSKSFKKWIQNLNQVQSSKSGIILNSKNISTQDLKELSFEYEVSKKTETTKAKKLKSSIMKSMINYTPPETGKLAYKSLKKHGKSIGNKWIIKVSVFNNNGYEFEIYKKDNEYFGLMPQDDFRQYKLLKINEKFMVSGDEFQDYKIITRTEFDISG